MALELAERSQVVTDLAMVGLRYVASFEGCPCVACQSMDLKFDVDVIAAEGKRPVFIAYRHQTEWEYHTITTRRTTDRGNSDSQVRKILERRSRADYHIQSYPRWIVVATGEEIRRALQNPVLFPCPEHVRGPQIGKGGQTFLTVCPMCLGGRVINRPGAVA